MNTDIRSQIQSLADKYAKQLGKQITHRMQEMLQDDRSHYLIYRVLGIHEDEGMLIDAYQNRGRFLYKYAGAFLEEACVLCIQSKYPDAKKTQIPNTSSSRPKNFEIDCLVGDLAHEIKWRDATAEGDHITKEHVRIQEIVKAGYVPVRVMFYYPQREQAQRIQNALKTLYHGVRGKYYADEEAWNYIKEFTDIDLKAILEDIALRRDEEGNHETCSV